MSTPESPGRESLSAPATPEPSAASNSAVAAKTAATPSMRLEGRLRPVSPGFRHGFSTRTSFNKDWTVRPPVGASAAMLGASRPLQAVTLPHDAMIGLERSAKNGSGSGYFPGGVFEYNKAFDPGKPFLQHLPAAHLRDRDQSLADQLDGAA